MWNSTRKICALALVAPMLMGNTCDALLNDDPFFEAWCGESLCDWTVEAGTVRKVSTWHSADHGVALDGPQVAISQIFEERDVDCLFIDLLTDVSPGANVELLVDFGLDGDVDVRHAIDGRDWNEVNYYITPPAPDASGKTAMKLTIEKTGDARAVLGRIALYDTAREHCTAPPTETD
ncbi:MAG: hypothetical protein ACE366_06150 [Bradymonadia bacterium]